MVCGRTPAPRVATASVAAVEVQGRPSTLRRRQVSISRALHSRRHWLSSESTPKLRSIMRRYLWRARASLTGSWLGPPPRPRHPGGAGRSVSRGRRRRWGPRTRHCGSSCSCSGGAWRRAARPIAPWMYSDVWSVCAAPPRGPNATIFTRNNSPKQCNSPMSGSSLSIATRVGFGTDWNRPSGKCC